MADTGAGPSQKKRKLNEELKGKDRRWAKPKSISVRLLTDRDNYGIINYSKMSPNWPSGM